MEKRWFQNVLLAIFTIILMAWAIYSGEKEKEAAQIPLTEIDIKQVQSITLERQTGEKIILTKNDQAQWHITEPLQLAAHTFRVEKLLNILEMTGATLIEDENLNLADLKLHPAYVTLHFDDTTVEVGDTSPLDTGQRYIKYNDKVYVVNDTFSHFLEESATGFASLSPLGEKVELVELHINDHHLKKIEKKWQLATTSTEADKIDSSTDALQTFITNWQTLQALSVQPYEAPEHAIVGKIVAKVAGKDKLLAFDIITTQPDFILANVDKKVQYQLPTYRTDQLLNLPEKIEMEEVVDEESISDVRE